MANLLGENILKQLGIDDLPPEKQEALLERVGEVLYGAIHMRVMEELDAAGKKELETLLEGGADEPLLAFLAARVPNLDAIVAEEVQKFRAQSLSFLQELDSPPH